MIKDFLELIRELLAMTPDSYYVLVATIIMPAMGMLCTRIDTLVSRVKSIMENDWFDLGIVVRDSTFLVKYFIIMLIEFVFFPVLQIFLFSFFEAFVSRFIAIVVLFMTSIIFLYIELKILKKRKFYREKFFLKMPLHIKMPYIVMNVYVFFFICDFYVEVVTNVLYALAIAFCIYCMLKKYNRYYVIYPHKQLYIYLNNGKKINCNDITKIKKKRKFYIVNNEEKEYKICYEDIKCVEYYGDMIIKEFK